MDLAGEQPPAARGVRARGGAALAGDARRAPATRVIPAVTAASWRAFDFVGLGEGGVVDRGDTADLASVGESNMVMRRSSPLRDHARRVPLRNAAQGALLTGL